MNDKALALIDFNDKSVVATLKNTVAKGLTDIELGLFAEFCKGTKLNPFKRETWAIKAGDRLQIMTGINGYWTIANNHPEFDGSEGGYISKDGQELPDTYPGTDWVGAWCRVYRKDRKFPTKASVFRSEYDKGMGNWKAMPKVMITKCAESVALRKAFPQELNGTYTEEEMPPEYGKSAVEAKVIQPASKPPAKLELHYYDIPAITKEQSLFMQKHAEYDGERNIWISHTDLGQKLAPYKFDPNKAKLEQVFEGDELPDSFATKYELSETAQRSLAEGEKGTIGFPREEVLPKKQTEVERIKEKLAKKAAPVQQEIA